MLAAQINLDMQTFSFQDAVRQKLVFDIHSASFNSLRTWSRKCGIANQEAYGESRQDLQAFLRQRLQEVISTFSEEDWCTLGSLADVVEIVKGSLMSCCPNWRQSLWRQRARESEPFDTQPNRLLQILEQLEAFISENGRFPRILRPFHEDEESCAWEKNHVCSVSWIPGWRVDAERL